MTTTPASFPCRFAHKIPDFSDENHVYCCSFARGMLPAFPAFVRLGLAEEKLSQSKGVCYEEDSLGSRLGSWGMFGRDRRCLGRSLWSWTSLQPSFALLPWWIWWLWMCSARALSLSSLHTSAKCVVLLLSRRRLSGLSQSAWQFWHLLWILRSLGQQPASSH